MLLCTRKEELYMEKYRKMRIITIFILLTIIGTLSLGFATFTSVLSISSTAKVTPDQSSFSVLFSSSSISQATNPIAATGTNGATGGSASISGTTISGLQANFTAPGQTVTYTFWAHNVGSYIAYLRNIIFGAASGGSTFKTCTAASDASSSLVTAACEDITVSVSVGSTSVTDTTYVTNHPLSIDSYEQVSVKITYASDGTSVDGDVNISFGDITLMYSSIDGENYSVTYDSTISSVAYPSSVAPGETLTITFTDTMPLSIKVLMGEIELDQTQYTYENGVLTIPNVQGDIRIEKGSITAKILSATRTPEIGQISPSTTAIFNLNLKKEVETETLKFVVSFTAVANGGGNFIYDNPQTTSYVYTDSSTQPSISISMNEFNGTSILIKIEMLNANNELYDSFTFNEYNHGTVDNPIWYTYAIPCLPAGTLVTVEVEEEDENGKKKKKRKKKRIEDLTYDDDLVVWDFDNGCFTTVKPLWLMKKQETISYNLLKFSDGTELKTVRQHRIFNKELGKFTYPMTDETPIGTTTFTDEGKEITLISKEVITEPVEYYNVISNYHMNIFAEGILTSCRLSNLYEIKDMKYVKDNRELVSREEYPSIPDEYFYGLRLAEQPKEINRGNDDKHTDTLEEYVLNLIKNQKK